MTARSARDHADRGGRGEIRQAGGQVDAGGGRAQRVEDVGAGRGAEDGALPRDGGRFRRRRLRRRHRRRDDDRARASSADDVVVLAEPPVGLGDDTARHAQLRGEHTGGGKPAADRQPSVGDGVSPSIRGRGFPCRANLCRSDVTRGDAVVLREHHDLRRRPPIFTADRSSAGLTDAFSEQPRSLAVWSPRQGQPPSLELAREARRASLSALSLPASA